MGVPIRCLLVDDNTSFLEATACLLNWEGVTVVGFASATTDALWQARALRPNVVLVDLMLGSESGFDLAQHLDETDSDHPAVILISPHAEADFADLIKELPVAGFMAKSNPLARAIRQLMPG